MNKNEEEQSDFAIWWIVHNQEKIIKEVQCCYVCDLPSVIQTACIWETVGMAPGTEPDIM